MNNSPFNWKNKTTFVPAKPEEKQMSTYDYLNNAENELRNALKSSSDLSQAYQLRRIAETIGTVESIKTQFKYSVTEEKKVKDGFFQRESYEDLYGNLYGNCAADTVNLGSYIPGAEGNDHIILG